MPAALQYSHMAGVHVQRDHAGEWRMQLQQEPVIKTCSKRTCNTPCAITDVVRDVHVRKLQ